MKAALYLRVSTRDGTQDTDYQRFQLRQLGTSQGWQIVTEYEDHESAPAASPAKSASIRFSNTTLKCVSVRRPISDATPSQPA